MSALPLEEVLEEVFGIPAGSIRDDLELHDIETWDSLTHMLMVATIESSYEVELSGDEIAGLRKVEDIRTALRRRDVQV